MLPCRKIESLLRAILILFFSIFSIILFTAIYWHIINILQFFVMSTDVSEYVKQGTKLKVSTEGFDVGRFAFFSVVLWLYH